MFLLNKYTLPGYKIFCNCRLLEDALKIAIEQKNGSGLMEIANACGSSDTELQAKIQSLLNDPTFRIWFSVDILIALK